MILRALERLPADRFETADALTRALGDPGFRHGETVPASTTMAGGGKRRWLAAVPWAATAGLAGLLIWALGTREQADEEEPFAPPVFVLEGNFQNVSGPEFEVAPDGQRLLLLERTAAASTTTLGLILNWRKELEERLGGR